MNSQDVSALNNNNISNKEIGYTKLRNIMNDIDLSFNEYFNGLMR